MNTGWRESRHARCVMDMRHPLWYALLVGLEQKCGRECYRISCGGNPVVVAWRDVLSKSLKNFLVCNGSKCVPKRK